MTQLASPTGGTGVASQRTRYVALAAQVALALAILGAAIPKLTGNAAMITMFDDLGGGDPLRLFVGSVELAGTVGLCIPRLRHLAALGLVLLLTCAALATVFMLQQNPLVPAILAAIAAYVARTSRG